MLPMDCLLMDHSTLVVYLQLKTVIAKKTSSYSAEALDSREDPDDSEWGPDFPPSLLVRLNSWSSSLLTSCS